MITYTQGNLLEADTEVLVNTVNTVGVMGKGIALMFKERYPQNMQAYAHACKQQEVNVGKMFVVPTEELLGAKWIVNFPTKQHWRNPSKMEWIESGLQDLQRFIIENNIQSIAIPPLGAGNGGLLWSEVKLRIEHYLSSLSDVHIVVYEPTAAYQNSKKTKGVTNLTPARALVLELIRQYLSVGMDCSEIEVQKMVYFLTRIIQTKNMEDPLHLNFKANKYGLYASNLTHLLNSLDGYYISAEKRIADSHASEPIIRFNYQYQDELQQYLQKHQTEFMPALSETLQIIEMFESLILPQSYIPSIHSSS